MSGTPFTVFDSNDVSVQGQATDVIANPNSGPRMNGEWFNVKPFQQLQTAPQRRFKVFRYEGRNDVLGPGYADWDFSAFKNIPLTESKELRFRASFSVS
jgi:hypothetical protein